MRHQEILDFGSGFGVTANHFAADNQVTAIEPSEELVQLRFSEYDYKQLIGSLDCLKQQPSEQYDVIFCHNVLEYAENPREILKEFHRVLKKGGKLSLIKHNHFGKIMQKAVFEYDLDAAHQLLKRGEAQSVSFGTIHEYELEDLLTGQEHLWQQRELYGIRMFFGLQNNQVKSREHWAEEMFALEKEAEQVPELRNIAFFHHIILEKK